MAGITLDRNDGADGQVVTFKHGTLDLAAITDVEITVINNHITFIRYKRDGVSLVRRGEFIAACSVHVDRPTNPQRREDNGFRRFASRVPNIIPRGGAHPQNCVAIISRATQGQRIPIGGTGEMPADEIDAYDRMLEQLNGIAPTPPAAQGSLLGLFNKEERANTGRGILFDGEDY